MTVFFKILADSFLAEIFTNTFVNYLEPNDLFYTLSMQDVPSGGSSIEETKHDCKSQDGSLGRVITYYYIVNDALYIRDIILIKAMSWSIFC